MRQLIARVADTISDWVRTQGYFRSDDDADAFHEELVYLLVTHSGITLGPLLATLLLEWIREARPQARIGTSELRAVKPTFVTDPLEICGAPCCEPVRRDLCSSCATSRTPHPAVARSSRQVVRLTTPVASTQSWAQTLYSVRS